MHRVGIIEACTLPKITTHLRHPSFDLEGPRNSLCFTKAPRVCIVLLLRKRGSSTSLAQQETTYRYESHNKQVKGRTLQTEGLSHLQVFYSFASSFATPPFRLAALQAGARQDPIRSPRPAESGLHRLHSEPSASPPPEAAAAVFRSSSQISGSQHRDLPTQQDSASDS